MSRQPLDPMIHSVVSTLAYAIADAIDGSNSDDDSVEVHVDISSVQGGIRFTLRMEEFGPLESPGQKG